MTSQLHDMTLSSIYFDNILFLLSSLVIGPSFMSISSLVLELWEFSFLRNWPEIWKSEVFPNIWRLGQVRDNEMLLNAQNAKVIAFTVSQLLRENQ